MVSKTNKWTVEKRCVNTKKGFVRSRNETWHQAIAALNPGKKNSCV